MKKIDRDKQRKEARDYIRDFKKDKCCAQCGYNKHTDILCFHHLKTYDKIKAVSLLIRDRAMLKRVIEEIKKCILLCPNCHSWLHFKKDGDL